MEQNTDKQQKLFYSIGEVAKMFNLTDSTLRYWEKEFPIIQPKRGAKGVRFYRQEDIDAIKLIHHLRVERGMTITGVQKKLKENKDTVVRQEELVSRLRQIKSELLALKRAFDLIESK